jgi:cytochrome c553
MKRILIVLLLAAVAAGVAAQSTKEVGQPFENAKAMCDGCHGISGYKTAFPNVYHVPKIGGQQPQYLLNALKAYKSGDRSHASMRGIAATLTEADMQKLAEHYGAAK